MHLLKPAFSAIILLINIFLLNIKNSLSLGQTSASSQLDTSQAVPSFTHPSQLPRANAYNNAAVAAAAAAAAAAATFPPPSTAVDLLTDRRWAVNPLYYSPDPHAVDRAARLHRNAAGKLCSFNIISDIGAIVRYLKAVWMLRLCINWVCLFNDFAASYNRKKKSLLNKFS